MTDFNPFGPLASSTRNSDVRNAKRAHMQNLGMGGGSSNSVGTQKEYPDHSDLPMPLDCEEDFSTPHLKCRCWQDAVEKALRITYNDMSRDLQSQINYYNDLSSVWMQSRDEGGCGGYKGGKKVSIPEKPCPAWLPGEPPKTCEHGALVEISCTDLWDKMGDLNKDTHALSAAAAAYLEKHGNDFKKTGLAVYNKCMESQK